MSFLPSGLPPIRDTERARPTRPLFVHGMLNYPPKVRARIDTLNDQLDSCLIHHGATRVQLGRGWTYRDPGLIASAACAVQQEAVNAYANSKGGQVGAGGSPACAEGVLGVLALPRDLDGIPCGPAGSAGVRSGRCPRRVRRTPRRAPADSSSSFVQVPGLGLRVPGPDGIHFLGRSTLGSRTNGSQSSGMRGEAEEFAI